VWCIKWRRAPIEPAGIHGQASAVSASRLRSLASLGAAIWLAACGAAPFKSPAPVDSGRLPALQARAEPAPEAATGFAAFKPGVTAQRFIVAAAHPLATDAGYQMLAAGGSAVDAAIAVQMVLTLVEPQSSGVGGGLFLLHHDGRNVSAIDGRETAPAAATTQLFLQDGQPMPFMQGVVGGRAVGTPGVLRALALAHRLHGKLAWGRLFEPAIRLAEQGFPIGPRLAALLREELARPLRLDPAAAAYFFNADGEPKPAGTVLRNPELASVLRAIAQRGDSAFYEGALARQIVDKVRSHPRNPGGLAESDLAGYRAVQRDALCFDYKAWRLCGMPPPSSGALAIGQMLGMLEHGALKLPRPVTTDFGVEPSVDAVHLFSEAGRLAFADRARYVADPDFAALPGGSAAALLEPRYLRSRAALIGARSMGVAAPGSPGVASTAWADHVGDERPSTSHVSIADAYGNALAMTTSIENAFGAQIMVRGFLLNNQLTDFSALPSADGLPVANRVEPGKRPRSSMAPTLVFERASGKLVASLGSPGGSAIPHYTAKVLIAMFEWGLDAPQAIALPNFGSRNGPTELELGRVSPGLIAALEARGHQLHIGPQTSGVQAITRVVRDGREVWFGAADPRREGTVRGE
jgi:gamma-glutamyltranspeptidase / glutathione hydrolase